MVALAFRQLSDLLGKRQRCGKVLEAEYTFEARDSLLSNDLPLQSFGLQLCYL